MLRLISAIKEYLVALGPGADDIDEQVSPGDGGDKAGWREPAECAGASYCIVWGGATALAPEEPC